MAKNDFSKGSLYALMVFRVMKILDFTKNWIETYYAEKEKGLRSAKISSLIIFLVVLSFFVLQLYLIKQRIADYEISPGADFWDGNIKALIFQFTIVLGLFIRFLALRFEGRYAQRFAETGILVAFSAWLAHFVWTRQWFTEASKIADICSPEILLNIAPMPAWFITVGFSGWLLYKIIFLIAVTWKTVRK